MQMLFVKIYHFAKILKYNQESNLYIHIKVTRFTSTVQQKKISSKIMKDTKYIFMILGFFFDPDIIVCKL